MLHIHWMLVDVCYTVCVCDWLQYNSHTVHLLSGLNSEAPRWAGNTQSMTVCSAMPVNGHPITSIGHGSSISHTSQSRLTG